MSKKSVKSGKSKKSQSDIKFPPGFNSSTNSSNSFISQMKILLLTIAFCLLSFSLGGLSSIFKYDKNLLQINLHNLNSNSVQDNQIVKNADKILPSPTPKLTKAPQPTPDIYAIKTKNATSGAELQPITAWQHYTNKEYGISLQYPTNFYIADKHGSISIGLDQAEGRPLNFFNIRKLTEKELEENIYSKLENLRINESIILQENINTYTSWTRIPDKQIDYITAKEFLNPQAWEVGLTKMLIFTVNHAKYTITYTPSKRNEERIRTNPMDSEAYIDFETVYEQIISSIKFSPPVAQ